MPKSILLRLKTENTPLIDGNKATFVWRGKSAPDLIGDFNGWEEGEPVSLQKIDRGIWIYELDLPSDAYIEYGFLNGKEQLGDPNNPKRTPNGFGGYNNFFSMPDFISTNLSRRKKLIPHGIITQHSLVSDQFFYGKERQVHLYNPPTDTPVPLVVVWDGQDYLHRMRLSNIIDNLIFQQRIRPIAIAFIDNGGQRSRTLEYACNDATLGFLMTEILPLASRELNLIDNHAFPGIYGVIGASMGGLMAVYTGTRFPHVFGNVLSQSGAFSLKGYDYAVFDLLNCSESRQSRFWLDAGMFDYPDLLESNRRMAGLLDRLGYRVEYHEYHAGHNYPAWGEDIWRGLEFLYGNLH